MEYVLQTAHDMKSNFFVLIVLMVLAACSAEKGPDIDLERQGREVPDFSADSAFVYIEKQLEFGPRVPGTPEHVRAKDWKRERLSTFSGSNVFVQEFSQQVYERDLDMFNILAAFNPAATDRILLAAHWDTRPRADAETDPDLQNNPIPGADDGASGVAVLLELARIMEENPPPLGVDIILFDGEDYGREGDLQYYFLGARHWVANPPLAGYKPRFGILLDMVGADGARFPKEQYSMFYAGTVVDQIWNIAADMGYGEYFINETGAYVLDDHWVVNENTEIPMLNIINHKPGEGSIFADHWHTHKDDIDIISKETLQAVGDVLVEVLYNRIGNK